jgi:hypothetical protein
MPVPIYTRTDNFRVVGRTNEQRIIPLYNEIPFHLIHELADKQSGNILETSRVIPPSTLPTVVSVKVELVGKTTGNRASPAYMATVRRRKAGYLCRMVQGVAEHAARDDLQVYTFPLLTGIKELLIALEAAEQEGGARELLRRLRDSLLDKGWEKYRAPETRRLVAETLQWLSETEEVETGKLNAIFQRLRTQGLASLAMTFAQIPVEEDEENGEEEVSD